MSSDCQFPGLRILLGLLVLLAGCQGGGSAPGGSAGTTTGGTARVQIRIAGALAVPPASAGASSRIQQQRVSGIPPEVTAVTVRITTNGQDIPNSPFNVSLETAALSVVLAANVEHLFTVDARNQRGESIFSGGDRATFSAGQDAQLPIMLTAREVLRLVATQMVSATTGGEVLVTDPQSALQGLRLLIPPGALAQDTTLTVTEATNPADVPALLSQVTALVDILPDGLLFAVPVTLTFPYDATLAGNLGFDEASLRVWRYNAVAGQWALVSEQEIDPVNKVIRTQLTSYEELTDCLYKGDAPLPRPFSRRCVRVLC